MFRSAVYLEYWKGVHPLLKPNVVWFNFTHVRSLNTDFECEFVILVNLFPRTFQMVQAEGLARYLAYISAAGERIHGWAVIIDYDTK